MKFYNATFSVDYFGSSVGMCKLDPPYPLNGAWHAISERDELDFFLFEKDRIRVYFDVRTKCRVISKRKQKTKWQWVCFKYKLFVRKLRMFLIDKVRNNVIFL